MKIDYDKWREITGIVSAAESTPAPQRKKEYRQYHEKFRDRAVKATDARAREREERIRKYLRKLMEEE